MIPLTTTTEGVGSCKDAVTINWAGLPSPIGLVAVRGTGKTWILETPFAVLYSSFAWYAGTPPSIHNALSTGGTGKGRLSMLFRHAGEKFFAERTFSKTGKTPMHKAVLHRDGPDGEMIAGPKVGDFDAKICAMMGDKKQALATWCLSQNRLGDLCGTPGDPDLRAHRREVFNRLIGADAHDALAERYAVRSRKLTATVEELEAQLAGERDPAIQIREAHEGENDAHNQRGIIRLALNNFESDLEQARTRLRDAEGGDDVLRAQVSELDMRKEVADNIKTRVVGLTAETERLECRASGLEAAVGKRARLETFTRLRDDHQADLAKWEEWQAWDHQRQSIEKDVEAAQRAVTTLEGFPGVDGETKALAERLPETEKEYQEAKARNEEAEAFNADLEAKADGVAARINAAHIELSRIQKAIADAPQPLFGDKCKPCPLAEQWADLPQQEKVSAELKAEAQSELADLPERFEIGNLDRFVVLLEQSRAAAKSVKDAAEAEETLAENRADLERHEMRRDGSVALEPDKVCDPRDGLQRAQKEIDANADAPARVEACQQAAQDAAAKKIELDKAEVALAEARAAEEAARGPAESAKATLANREEQRATLRAEVATLETKVQELRAEVDELTRQIAKHEARIEELERRQKEQAEKRARVKRIRDDLAALADLRLFAGPKGARQLLIDNAAPELETIADDLFTRATGGRQRLRIATQRALADGSIAEDFQILVRDAEGERDVLSYSGGELQLIRIIFRSAVALWVAKLHGVEPEFLALDEACDGIGAEGSEAIDELMCLLEYLGQEIPTIWIVTHSPAIADRMRSQVRLRKTFGGVEVQTAGGQNNE